MKTASLQSTYICVMFVICWKMMCLICACVRYNLRFVTRLVWAVSGSGCDLVRDWYASYFSLVSNWGLQRYLKTVASELNKKWQHSQPPWRTRWKCYDRTIIYSEEFLMMQLPTIIQLNSRYYFWFFQSWSVKRQEHFVINANRPHRSGTDCVGWNHETPAVMPWPQGSLTI